MISVKDDTARGIGVLFCDLAFIIMAFFDDTVRIVAFVICFPISLIALECFKKIQMTKDGCLVKLLWTEKFYPWSAFQTIRLLDFRKCATKSRGGAHYSEGILFFTKRIKNFSFKADPPSFLFLHDPFCRRGFYIQFPPEWSYKKKELGTPVSELYSYRVDRAEFMSKVEEWGLKIEGLNVPMPPEQLAAKKKR